METLAAYDENLAVDFGLQRPAPEPAMEEEAVADEGGLLAILLQSG